MNKVIRDLLSRKTFIFSIVVILFFAAIALLAPVLTSYNNPYQVSQQFVAAPYAVPAWATIFPQYHDLPPDVRLTLTPVSASGVTPVNSSFVKITVPAGGEVNVSYPIRWNWSSPYNVILSFILVPPATSDFNVNLYMNNINIMELSPVPIPPAVSVTLGKPNSITFSSQTINPSNSPYVNSLPFQDQPLASLEFPKAVLPRPGMYYLVISLQNTGNSPETFLLSNPHYTSLGYAYGRLGTDDNGGSVFSEFVYGARFDLYLALVASVLIIGIGLIIGLLAGYVGGFTDLTLNALTDFFLLIPGLPLLIVLISIFDLTGVIVNVNKAVLILLIISFLSWPGTAKIIRGQTLSLRSRTFVEASRALGEGKLRILFRHIVPNLMGILFAQLAYDVPGVILAESGLDFLGLGIIGFPTWGNMLGFATNDLSFANGFAWWWVLPPGIGIILLSTAFYYFGTAMLDVLSPYKLRGE
ncbi:ABC transporter permease [Metallosphaera javensis (ex Sakai et al. 2022)]|uniref:ABC transporter permease n=1 Tax=Metallosphaera javensis (ex Sakai et al. 2022) TaxID=2775498 RepID=UPI0025880113|nr:MAG: peptide transporter [Metallosphaera javensis (ex Sakai et al. 2022)]